MDNYGDKTIPAALRMSPSCSLPVVLAECLTLIGIVAVAVIVLAVVLYYLLVCVMVLMILWAVTDGWIILFGILWALLYGGTKVYLGEW